MELEIIEEKEGMLSLEIKGETHTFLNLLTDNSWKEGAKQASYIVEHPYLSQPRIIIRAKDPKKILKDSAQKIIDDCQEFSKGFKRGLSK